MHKKFFPTAFVLALAALALVVGAIAESGKVVSLNDKTATKALGERSVFIKFFAQWCGHCKNMAQDYVKLAELLKDDDVTIAEVDEKNNGDILSAAKIEGFPTLKFYPKGSDISKGIDYNGERNANSMAAFVRKQLKGITTKSTDTRHAADGDKPVAKEHVTTLDTETFDTIALNPNRTVLVEFYAPWCGHCKTLAPIYEEIAAAFERDKKNVVIAKVDATVNSRIAEKYGVQGYPTLKIFPAEFDKTKPIMYEGERIKKNLIEFVNAHAGTYRLPDGSLAPGAGVLSKNKDDIRKLLATITNKESAANAGKKLAAKLKADGSDKSNRIALTYYQRGFELVGEDNGKPAKLNAEIARLAQVLKNTASIDGAKADEMTVRSNVLQSLRGLMEDRTSDGDL